MGNYYKYYWDSLVRDIPADIIIGLLFLLVIGCAFIFARKGFRNGLRAIVFLILIEYVVFLMCSTVIIRSTLAYSKYDFAPFWSYRAYFRGDDPYLMPENMMNALVFVPIGLLAGATFRQMNWKKVLCVGVALSVFIEVMQFFFKRGFAEFDDVFHNTVGCMIGYGLYVLIKCLLRYE